MDSRSIKFSRSLSSLNIFLRSIPLIITWCRRPGVSIRAIYPGHGRMHTP